VQRGSVRERQIHDLEHVRRAISERFPGIAVETYFARLDNGAGVFEAV
jgi:hypothetical protein